MPITRKLQSMLMPVAMAAAAMAAPGIANAAAVAQSYLYVNNFTFTQAPGGSVSVVTATDSGDVSASLNGVTQTDTFNSGTSAGNFTLQKQVGPNAGSYSPGVAITKPTFPALNYAGSYSSVSGDPFAGNVVAGVDNTVVLNPGGAGTSQSNTNLAANFTLSVGAGTVLGVNFDADGFLRAALDPLLAPGGANASFRWDISLRDSGGALVFQWAPDGLVGSGVGVIGGTETADAFDMTDERAVTLGGLDFTTGVLSGAFAATTNSLAAGLYQLNITHLGNADASMNIPEPGALALVALALVGLGVTTRRKQSGS